MKRDQNSLAIEEAGLQLPQLTKREYFAALAIQGLSSGIFSNEKIGIGLLNKSDEDNISPQKYIVGMALELADELIKELNKYES